MIILFFFTPKLPKELLKIINTKLNSITADTDVIPDFIIKQIGPHVLVPL